MPDAYESFDQPDSVTLGPNHAWVKLGDGSDNFKTISNQLGGTMADTTRSHARVEVGMMSDDHYAEIQITALSSSTVGSVSLGPFVRAASPGAASLGDNYGADINSAGKIYLYKTVAGVRTNFVDGAAITIGTLPGVLRLQVRGSTLTLFWRGATVKEVTDTSIPGSTTQRGVGVFGYQVNTGGRADDFRARTPIKLMSFSGSITPAGAISTKKIVTLVLSGSLTPSGTLERRVTRIISLAGSIAPAGALRKLATKNRVGRIKPAGVMRRGIRRTFAGSITPAGDPGIVFLGRVLGRAGAVIMEIRRAGEVRMRFRRR